MILDAEERLIIAVKSSDVPTLDDLLHDDLLFHIPSGDIITKAMDLDAHRSGKMVVEVLTVLEQEIRCFGDTAIASILIETIGRMIDQRIEGKFRYIRTWKLLGHRLQIIGGSCIASS